jgi:3-oxoacyl-[acyl-carrier protein] reductase
MNKVAVVTGSRKGLGLQLAEWFLSEGWYVAGCSRRPGVIEHKSYRHYQLDVSDEAAVVEMVSDVRKGWSRIDSLINNAGVAAMNHLLLTPGKSAEKVMQTNFLGSFYFMREVGKVMIRQKTGSMINFSTVASPLNLEGEAVYAASKRAVESLTQVGAREMGAFGVTVNAIGPTPIDTDLIRLVPEEKIAALVDRQAIKRKGVFKDVLNVVRFFVAPDSRFITGQIIYLGGING